MSVGKQLLNKRRNNCIAVIGDGAITGGMAYEAMNWCPSPQRPTPTPTHRAPPHPSAREARPPLPRARGPGG